ncbi:ubiquinone biosynthesis O-methyltransferase, mitochondrial isoform X1 [Osmerus eperlanus]|uniref:ubiquinone biosynthesis O-methyltransferase, mitochondrial isoform X1 n=1 Tax=Osmerus eperlanus TaxID=29151 RepID=UPI002E12990F
MYCKKFGELVQGICTTSLKRDGAASRRRVFSWTSVCQRRTLLLNRRAYPAVQLRPVPNHVSLSYTCRACYASQSTVDPDEVKKFQALASKWWDEQGEFAALHSMNDLRVPFIRDNLMSVHGVRHPGKPLAGLRILDMGCGGGLLTEPLGRLGADVLGIDPAANSIGTAELHTFRDPELQGRVTYRACTLEELSQGLEGEGGEVGEGEEESFDAVVASEVVEHLADLDTFALCCGHVLKPGGSLFITTISKTNLSYALAIVAAERVLGIVPSGTHDWDKFITPVDLERLLESNGFSVESIQGMQYNPVSAGWSWTQSTSVNYALHAVKRKEEPPPGHTQTGPAHTGGRDAPPSGHN